MELETLNILKTYDSNIKILDLEGKHINGILDLSRFTCLEELNCSQYYNNITLCVNIPNTLKIFYCPNSLNSLNNLPNSITHLILGNNFNQNNLMFNEKINLKNNNSLEYLSFCDETLNGGNYYSYNHFEYGFNQSIINLPNTIKHLFLGHNYNQEISKLPEKIECLELGKSFNQSIDNLDDNLKILRISGYFQKGNIKYYEPDIMFYSDFNKNINKLPNNLIKFSLQINLFKNKINNFFENILEEYENKINLIKYYANFKINNKKLEKLLNELFEKFKNNNIININYLPKSIKEIYFINSTTNINYYNNEYYINVYENNDDEKNELKLFLENGATLINFDKNIDNNINIRYLTNHFTIGEFKLIQNTLKDAFKKIFYDEIINKINELDRYENKILDFKYFSK